MTGQGFKACLFRPDLGNEVVAGRLFVDRWGLRFQSESVSEEIPADRMEVEWKEDDDRIYFQDAARPGLKIYTLDQSILDLPTLSQLADARREVGEVAGRRELSRRLRLTLCFLIGFACVAWLFSWATSAMVRSLAAKVPAEWEQDFGEASLDALREKTPLDQFSNQVAQLTALAAPLIQRLPLGNTKIRFYIVENPKPNAFALPGGHVVVNTGLLEMTDRPEELLGVLAHELAHVTQKHYAQKIISSSGPLIVFGVFLRSRDGLLNVLSTGSGVMIAQGFSQSYETEADDVGWKYLVAANIDPRGMTSMFRKFKIQEAKETGPGLPQAFSSHPALNKRIARLEGKEKRLSPRADFLRLTNQIPKVEPP